MLKGISSKTPLGNIVLIRAEEDRETLKNFTQEQHKIRNDWRNKHSSTDNMSDEEKKQAEKEVQNLFAQMFG